MEFTFGEYIRLKRSELGYPLKKVASYVKIDPSMLSKIEKDERPLNLDYVDKLSSILKADKKTLLNYFYSKKIVDEIKDYSDYKEVLNIVTKQLDFYFSHQEKDEKNNWKEKEFRNPNATIRLGTMFSGIGAIEFAIKRLGLKTDIKFACDNDAFVKKSYFANYNISEENWFNDVCDIDGNDYRNDLDLLVGGSPCQSFSMVGKRRGFEDTRGTLFYEFARVVKESQPKVFISS